MTDYQAEPVEVEDDEDDEDNHLFDDYFQEPDPDRCGRFYYRSI